MWNTWKKQDAACNTILDSLEEYSVANKKEITVESLLASLPHEQQAHALNCVSCRTALQDFVTVRHMLAAVPAYSTTESPWFAARVMSAIAAHEYELSVPLTISAILPRIAARLTWVTSLVLLIASAFLFQRPITPPVPPPAATTAQDSLFDSSQIPTGSDDILLSLSERNHER